MDKSIYTDEYRVFLSLLRQVREEAGLTQTELATHLNETQSFISKCERGERRIDVVELQKLCFIMGLSLSEFVMKLESVLNEM